MNIWIEKFWIVLGCNKFLNFNDVCGCTRGEFFVVHPNSLLIAIGQWAIQTLVFPAG